MKNENQSAFPVPSDVLCIDSVPVDGLTKREYFAAMAMQGILSNSLSQESMMPQDAAYRAILCADELLKQLETK